MNHTKWRYLGSSRIDSARRVAIPEDVFEEDILKRDNDLPSVGAWWSYQETTGILVVSDEPLDGQCFNVVGRRNVGDKSDSYRVTIPKAFFEASDNQTTRSVAQKVPSFARLKPNSELHFITRNEMILSSPRSAYVLSVEKLQRVLGDFEESQIISETTPR